MNKDMVLKAMDRIEALLLTADLVCERTGGLGDISHAINNARQIAGAVKILIDE